jgi:hypothetical protein
MTDTRKLFTLAMGMEWFEPKCEPPYECPCMAHQKPCYYPDNPQWDNPTAIKEAIQNIPCDKCGGDGFIAKGSCETCNIKHRPACQKECPCSCNNGVIDDWDGFILWHMDSIYLSEILKTITTTGIVVAMDIEDDNAEAIKREAHAEILLDPNLLRPAYLGYKEGR